MFFARAKKNPNPLLLLAFFFLATFRLAAAPTGPTLQFDYGQGQPQKNAVSKFMYFVPLISPDPVSVFTNAGNTQCARVLSLACQTNGNTFVATCEFEFTGTGFQQNIFDLTAKIKRRQNELQNGGIIKHALAAINVTGTGSGNVEIAGVITNGVRQVNQVRLRGAIGKRNGGPRQYAHLQKKFRAAKNGSFPRLNQADGRQRRTLAEFSRRTQRRDRKLLSPAA